MGTHGYRRGTRHMFSKKFRKRGPIKLSTYLRVYKVGDYVDIKVDGSVQKGMPFKYYHGKTGRVYNVTKRALGVIVTKQVRNHMLDKRINVRVEHVKPSRCREDFLKRVKENDEKRRQAKENGEKIPRGSLKRQPQEPRGRYLVKAKKIKVKEGESVVTKKVLNIEDLVPIKYEFLSLIHISEPTRPY